VYATINKEYTINPCPKRNQANTYTYPDCLSVTERESERERRLSSRKSARNRTELFPSKEEDRTHPTYTCTLPGSSELPSDAHIRMESERAFINTRFPSADVSSGSA